MTKDILWKWMGQYARYIIGGMVIIILFLVQNRLFAPIQSTQTKMEITSVEQTALQNNTKMMIDIKGAVVNPGVYAVDANSRVVDVVALAGGFREDADTQKVNLAKIISDEMVIYVPSINEVQVMDFSENTIKINLNTATKEQLMTLKGIGESKADAIIERRKNKGKFDSVDELVEIKGISNKVIDAIKDDVTVQ